MNIEKRSDPAGIAEKKPFIPVILALILILTVFVYFPSLKNQFTYDDKMVIHEAGYLLSNPVQIPRILTKDYFLLSGESTYRPFVTLSYILDWQLGKGNPVFFHIHNLLWHLVTVTLLLLLFNQITKDLNTAAVIVSIYALHPVLTEAVDNISFREDLIATALGLLAVLIWISDTKVTRFIKNTAAAVIFLVAQLSKESAVTFLFILFLLFWYLDTTDHTVSIKAFTNIIKKRKAELGSAVLTVCLFIVIRFIFFSTGNNYGEDLGNDILTTMMTTAVIFANYLKLLFLPHPLCADYRGVIPLIDSLLDPKLLLSLFSISALLIPGWLLHRKKPLFFIGIIWFFAALLPVSNIIGIPVFKDKTFFLYMPYIGMAERYLYMPYIGLVLSFGYLLCDLTDLLKKRLRFRISAVSLLIVILICLGSMTRARHKAWFSDETLWHTTLSDHPDAYGAMHGYATALLRKDKYDESIEYFEKALKFKMPESEKAAILNDLGIAYTDSGKHETAISTFKKALKIHISETFHYNLGVAYLRMGRYEKASKEFESSIKLDPFYSNPYLPLIDIYSKMGKTDKAQTLQKKAISFGFAE
ncbi:tetratricopeptide repeat protein [Elusimicrobiota bacterium]